MGGISKTSIQWEFETRQLLPLSLDVADVCHFFSVLEEPSAWKPLFHSVVAAEVLELELRLRSRNTQTLVGNLCGVASCAPPVVRHDLRVLLSSAKNQLKTVKPYNVEEWTNQVSRQVHFRSVRWCFPSTMTRPVPYGTRLLGFPTHGDILHITASSEMWERMEVVVRPVLCAWLAIHWQIDRICWFCGFAWFLARSLFITLVGS